MAIESIGGQSTIAADQTTTPNPRSNSQRDRSPVIETRDELLARTVDCPKCSAPIGAACVGIRWTGKHPFVRQLPHHEKRLTFVYKVKERNERLDRQLRRDPSDVRR